MLEQRLQLSAARKEAERLLKITNKPAHIVRKPGIDGYLVTQEAPHSTSWKKQKLEHVETVRNKTESDNRRKYRSR